jgi:hypothetical protein
MCNIQRLRAQEVGAQWSGAHGCTIECISPYFGAGGSRH